MCSLLCHERFPPVLLLQATVSSSPGFSSPYLTVWDASVSEQKIKAAADRGGAFG